MGAFGARLIGGDTVRHPNGLFLSLTLTGACLADNPIRRMGAQAGEDLGWFFEVYLRQPDLPVLEARVENDTLFLEWTVPEGLEFPMPVPLLLGDRMLRVEMPNGQAEVALQGQSFEVDPAQRILKASRRRRGAERGR